MVHIIPYCLAPWQSLTRNSPAGHNLGLAHAGKFTNAYGDQSGIMVSHGHVLERTNDRGTCWVSVSGTLYFRIYLELMKYCSCRGTHTAARILLKCASMDPRVGNSVGIASFTWTCRTATSIGAVISVHSLTSGLLPGYPEPENIYIQLSHYRQRRYLLPSSLSLRLLH